MAIAKKMVSVIGGADPSAGALRLAEEVGRELAARGVVVVCGGLGGVMEAACRGAAEAGGLTVGILPGASRADANPYVQVPVVTGIGYARNAAVARSGQAVIAIDGSYGTISEIAFALQAGTPVVGLLTWEFTINGEKDRRIIPATTAVEAVEKALQAIL
ncbi:TIGR00725 family protein [Chloroflexota bacterium]